MDKFEMNELLDFYGGLLTENQQKISNDYFREDYSYQEIAENMNISRTAVYDTIKRVKQELENYESILGCNKAYKNRCTIYKKIKEGAHLKLYFYETPYYKRIEDELIRKYKPELNVQKIKFESCVHTPH